MATHYELPLMEHTIKALMAGETNNAWIYVPRIIEERGATRAYYHDLIASWLNRVPTQLEVDVYILRSEISRIKDELLKEATALYPSTRKLVKNSRYGMLVS